MSAELLDKHETRIKRMFGQIAPWYDVLNHLLSLNIDRSWRRKTIQLVPAFADRGPILDVCTGTGDLAIGYHRAVTGSIPVIGADFCHPMLTRAMKKASKPGQEKTVTFLEADAQHLPFSNDTFQIVSVAFGLRNITDPDRGLAEMVRVAQAGGRVAILEFSRPTAPVLGRVYTWYFRSVLPRVGQVIARNPESAYRYLPESVMAFPDGEQLASKMRQHGLENVVYHPLTFGIATLYIGTKPRISASTI